MTPKEKADQLIRRYTLDFTMDFDLSRQAALICVYEIIEDRTDGELDSAYWQEVRMELAYMRTDRHEARADRFNLDL
jgi:hypothetical protein